MTFGQFDGRFLGRTAVVTGGASGLGRAVVDRLVKEGGRVVAWDKNAEALEDVQESMPEVGAFQVDVADAAQVDGAADRSANLLGHIDILVNCAGITGATAPAHNYPLDSWKNVLAVNLDGTFYSCRAIVPLMIQRGYGRIVNVSSVAGKEGNPNASAYSAAKAGVIGFTKSIGKELALSGILANCVTPATFQSPILAQLPQGQIDYMRSRIPMERLGQAHECAALICWLVSEECSFSTAATFDISGGRTTY